MSDSLALDPSPLPAERTTKLTHRFSLATMFKAAMESLVAAHSHRFEDSERLFYRYPPV